MTSDPADGIRRLGFRKWYERRLIDAHVSLVSALLAGVLAAVVIEALPDHGLSLYALFLLVTVLASGAFAFWSARRFLALLGEAQRIAERSTCEHCQRYGRFSVLASGGTHGEGWLRVECRKCGHQWSIP